MLALGTSAQIRARGTFSDQTTQDLTSLVTWSSSNPEVAQVTALGQVQGLQVGSTQLEASLGEVSKVAALEVSEATVLSLAVVTTTGEPPQVPTGQSLSLQAVATLADKSFQNVTESVTWSVDQSLLGSLGNPSGGSILLNTLNPGLITVSANLQAQGTTFSAELPISILATRPDFILAGGTTHHLNTDTGGYTVDGVPRSLPGWDPSNGRLSVGRFTVEAGATLNLEGSRAFQVSASDPIVVEEAIISFSGQNGANGQSGTSSTPAGGIGERGGNIALVTSSSFTVDGQILNRGGSGGNNNFSDYGPAGGNGGAGGSLTLLAQGAITLGGNLSSSGGPGGSSNSSFASNASGGGIGGSGGAILVQSEQAISSSGTLQASGGNGGGNSFSISGPGGGRGGDGGGITLRCPGDLFSENISLQATGGNGGNGNDSNNRLGGGSGGNGGGHAGLGGTTQLRGDSALTLNADIASNGGTGGNNNTANLDIAGGNGGNARTLSLITQGLLFIHPRAYSLSGGNGGTGNVETSGFGSNGGRGGNGGSITGSANEVQGSFPGNTVQGGQGNSGGSNGSNGSITAAFR